MNSIYSDNVQCAFGAVDDAKTFFHASTTALSEGGFNLRKWCSNDESINEYIESQAPDFFLWKTHG